MDETKDLSESGGSEPATPGSAGSSDETKDLSETGGSPSFALGSSGSPDADPRKIGATGSSAG